MKKYIFITGGVLSSIGKGVITASIAKILQARGFSVTTIKIDPYFNVDAGTMNPYQHGEVFVTADGGETDLDLGHYERFLDVELTKDHNITSGKVYLRVIMDERAGKYLGQTVQLIPHVTDEIKREIRHAVDRSDASIGIVEIGGTVGDYESLPFLEAIRQMRLEEGYSNTVFVHVALVPIIETTGEPKTKPLQHSVFELRRIGIQPDIIIARCRTWLDDDTKRKIALFTNVAPDAIFTAPYVDTIYRIPLILDEEGLGDYLTSRLGLEKRRAELGEWCRFIEDLLNPRDEVSVGLCGKYVKLKDSYLSILEALNHASARLRVKPRLVWIDAEAVEQGSEEELEKLKDIHCLIVLPGFGTRGAEGKIQVIRETRELGLPFLGICFGMQLAVVEFARNVMGLSDANSTEIDPDTSEPVIDLAPEQKNIDKVGGTMMLGNKPVRILKDTLAFRLYNTDLVYERHRHRYVVNERYIDKLERAGMRVSGYRADSPHRIVEIVELKDHVFYVGTQFHPEFRSRPLRPHPVFIGLLDAALRFKYSSRR